MAWPGARGLGPGMCLKYDNCVAGRVGPGHTFCGPGRARASQFSLRAGPGPGLHNSYCCVPGPGLGLKSYLRAGPGSKCQACAGP